MGTVYHNKNGAASAALAGLERGLNNGIELGQRSRALADHEQQQEFERQQAIRQAQIADEQIAQEGRAQAASGEAAAEYAKPEAKTKTGAFGTPSKIPFVGQMQQAGNDAVAYQGTLDRVGAIAKRMAENGVPLGQVASFVDSVKERHKRFVDEDIRKRLIDQVGRGTAAGSFFAQQPDGSRTETPELHDALSQWAEMAANPNTPLEMLRTQKSKIDKEQIAAKSAFTSVQRQATTLHQQVADAQGQAQQTQMQGPMAAGAQQAQDMRLQKMDALATSYEHMMPQLLGGPKKDQDEFQQKFWQEWSLAQANIAYIDKNGQPITFENESAHRQLEDELLKAQTAHENASANYYNSGGSRSGTSGVKGGLTEDQALERAHQMLGDTADPNEVRALADQMMKQGIGVGGAPQQQGGQQQSRIDQLTATKDQLVEGVRNGTLPSDPKQLAAILRGDSKAPTATKSEAAPKADRGNLTEEDARAAESSGTSVGREDASQIRSGMSKERAKTNAAWKGIDNMRSQLKLQGEKVPTSRKNWDRVMSKLADSMRGHTGIGGSPIGVDDVRAAYDALEQYGTRKGWKRPDTTEERAALRKEPE